MSRPARWRTQLDCRDPDYEPAPEPEDAAEPDDYLTDHELDAAASEAEARW